MYQRDEKIKAFDFFGRENDNGTIREQPRISDGYENEADRIEDSESELKEQVLNKFTKLCKSFGLNRVNKVLDLIITIFGPNEDCKQRSFRADKDLNR